MNLFLTAKILNSLTFLSPILSGPYFSSFINPGNPHIMFKLVGAHLY